MEFSLNKKKVKTLNTHGCCLFCLKASFNSDLISENVEKRNSVLLRCLSRYLKLNPNHFDCSSNTPTLFKTSEQMDLEVELCQSCEKLNHHFSHLFQQFEKTQMEMNYFLERIQQNISNSVKSPERVQNYSKKMTSNQESLTELVFVDKLRKEIADKSFSNNEGARVCVTRMNVEKIIKSEVSHENVEDSVSQCNSALPPEEDLEVGEIFSCRDLIKQEPSKVIYYIKNSGKYDCKSCKKPFRTSSAARQHYESFHLNKKFKCNSCNGVYKYRSTLRKHKCNGAGSKGSNVFYTRNAGIYHCKKCDKTYKDSSNAARHYRAVHLNKRYKCDQCQAALSTQFNLQTHKKTCQKAIEKRLAMENDPAFKFCCELCGSRFPLAKKLSQHHWSVHSNINRYPCEFCNRKFKKGSHLNDHKNAVHLGKRFPCRICKKDFAYMYVTRIHEKKCAREEKIKVEPQDEA